MFKNIELIKDSIALCVTKADRKRKVESLKNKYFEDIKNLNESLSAASKKVIEYAKNSTFIFYNQIEDGDLPDDDLFDKIYSSI